MMNRQNDALMIFGLGALAGAVAALLLAPQSGQETRQAIRRGADGVVNRGSEAIHGVGRRVHDAKERVEEKVGSVRDAIRKPAENAKAAAQAAKTAYNREMEGGA